MIAFLSNASRMASSTAFWVSFACLAVSFLVLGPRCKSVKQRAWVLTAISSAVMSLCSLPLIIQYAAARGQIKHVTVPAVVTDAVGRFFQAYLIVDLTMGMLFYRSKVNLLTGWIHHSVYIFIVEYAIQGRWSHIFCLAAIMEIPTFVLAIGSIVSRLRSDVVFALTFFSTRILLHIVLCVSLFVQRQQVTDGAMGPAIIMSCIFPLHAHWFTGCIKGFIKRAKTEKSAPPSKPSIHVATLPERPITPISMSSVPASFYASRASLARRRTALRMAVRARWDQLKTWKASGRLGEMQRRVRAALPGRERVYQYVGYNSTPSLSLESDEGFEVASTMSAFS